VTDVVAAAILALWSSVTPQGGQTCRSAATLVTPGPFVECARWGTERYRDRSVAIREGYRLVGRDFPGMGEHWIRVRLVFDAEFDASRPEVLNYITVAGKPVLVGVGYAIPLLEGEEPPAGPAGQHAWHDHTRTIDDETVLPSHRTHDLARRGARLAMMHAWIWSAGPETIFATDNWALPFLRAGSRPPPEPPPAAAKALSLASGGRDYFEMAIEAAGSIDPSERRGVQTAFDAAERDVQSLVRTAPDSLTATTTLARLTGIWTALWETIDRTVGPETRRRLARLPIR